MHWNDVFDSTVYVILSPWKNVFDSRSMEALLSKFVAPKLVAGLRASLVINPANQVRYPVALLLLLLVVVGVVAFVAVGGGGDDTWRCDGLVGLVVVLLLLL